MGGDRGFSRKRKQGGKKKKEKKRKERNNDLIQMNTQKINGKMLNIDLNKKVENNQSIRKKRGSLIKQSVFFLTMYT